MAAERLQCSDASLFWSNIVGLLYSAATAHDAEATQRVRTVHGDPAQSAPHL